MYDDLFPLDKHRPYSSSLEFNMQVFLFSMSQHRNEHYYGTLLNRPYENPISDFDSHAQPFVSSTLTVVSEMRGFAGE